MTYRHKTKTTVSGDTANFLASLIEDDEGQKTIVPDAYKRTEMDFTLPSKLGVGMRLQFDENSFLAVDYEHGFNSQNEEAPVRFSKNSDDDVEGENQANDKDAELVSKFSWFDASTVRVGLEREIELSTANARSVKVRLGHIYDGQTANPKYPTPFGTPAAPTHTYTAGLGYETASYEMNFAYAFRSGAVTITPEDIEGNGCVTCGDEGKYELKLHGFYLDYTHYFN